jgi:ribosomal protein S18 acetylase RimI-like enzyme
MHTEFRRTIIPHEVRSLMAFDRKVFRPSDRFTAAYWRYVESYWMLVDGVKVGCCAFETDVIFEQDRNDEATNPPQRGSLYIASTAILPRFQCHGFGRILKAWQVAYAERHGYARIVTNTRKRNETMIHLNRKFGFKVIRTTPDYYDDPPEPTVVMELRLGRRSR